MKLLHNMRNIVFGGPEDPLGERLIHFLPLEDYQSLGYHEHAACGQKTWRYSLSTRLSDLTCHTCRSILENRHRNLDPERVEREQVVVRNLLVETLGSLPKMPDRPKQEWIDLRGAKG